jgi:hypothetical protein
MGKRIERKESGENGRRPDPPKSARACHLPASKQKVLCILATPYVAGEQSIEGLTVARVIEFYIPTIFSKRVKWLPLEQRGRVIEFCLPTKTSCLTPCDPAKYSVTLLVRAEVIQRFVEWKPKPALSSAGIRKAPSGTLRARVDRGGSNQIVDF